MGLAIEREKETELSQMVGRHFEQVGTFVGLRLCQSD